jgi:3-dehydroquinate synthase
LPPIVAAPHSVPPIRIDIATESAAYPVLIGPGLSASLAALLDAHGFSRQRFIVSSPTVWKLHRRTIARGLARVGVILIPDGERAKTTQTVMRIYDALVKGHADRAAGLVAIGGGVVGDVAGFAAATYLRGIAVAHVPTTLLAQVDSAVGGKVGVNHPLGKNLIGAFHQPRLVAADPTLLLTLSRREFRAGLYEVVKYGMAFEASLFEQLRASLRPVLQRDAETLTPIVAESCRIKAGVVMQDERERGPRRLLNFGHTAGHAFEAVTRYRRFRHGEAIAWGMLVAAELSVRRRAFPVAGLRTLSGLITALGPLPPVGDLKTRDVLAAMRRDKKIVDGRLHFVLVTDVGRAEVVDDVTEEELKTALVAVGLKK